MSNNRGSDCSRERPPLIVQAEALALHLNPPKSPEKPAALTLPMSPKPGLPAIGPPAPSASFKLRATSYYPHQPAKSMALISEIDSAEGSERWVKEGSQLGHLVVQEIRRGSITYRSGDQVREMMVEPVSSPPSLVRDLRPGTRQVSAATGRGDVLSSVSVDTNSISVGRN